MSTRGSVGVLVAMAMATPSVAWAELRPVHRVDPNNAARVRADQLATDAAQALVRGDGAAALAAAERAVGADPTDPWAYYDRGAALATLGRVDDALASFKLAEARFGDYVWGRSVAIYGRANALSVAGRCVEASAAFGEYAAVVKAYSVRAADRASRAAAACRPPWKPSAVAPASPSPSPPSTSPSLPPPLPSR